MLLCAGLELVGGLVTLGIRGYGTASRTTGSSLKLAVDL